MGKRQRRRNREQPEQARATAATSDYSDGEGNVLTLRASLSEATLATLREAASAAATADDLWRRRSEMLFERLAVRWTIAGLPLEGERELLGRYRLADEATQRWVRETVIEHLLGIGVEL